MTRKIPETTTAWKGLAEEAFPIAILCLESGGNWHVSAVPCAGVERVCLPVLSSAHPIEVLQLPAGARDHTEVEPGRWESPVFFLLWEGESRDSE